MSILLILHIVLMIASLVATVGSAITSLFGITTVKSFTRVNIAVTTVGIASGIVLLIQAPSGSRCAVLLAYLLAFAAAQVYVSKRNQRFAASAS